MKLDRRAFLAGSGASSILPSRLPAQVGAVLSPEDFGARGDGKSNDDAAFAALSAEVNRRRGGTLSLRPGRTYIVGAQSRGTERFGWEPAPVLHLHDLLSPFKILGNGARLRCQNGLRFGTFDPATGQPVHRAMPNFRRS